MNLVRKFLTNDKLREINKSITNKGGTDHAVRNKMPEAQKSYKEDHVEEIEEKLS